MPDDNVIIEREAADALRTARSNRDELVKFFKDLASANDRKLTPALRKKAGDHEDLDKCMKLLKKAAAKADPGGKDFESDAARMSVALFLIERTGDVCRIAAEKDSLGIFSLASALRAQVSAMLTEEFYSKPMQEVISLYIDIEPLLTASLEMSGLAVVDLESAARMYKGRLASMMK